MSVCLACRTAAVSCPKTWVPPGGTARWRAPGRWRRRASAKPPSPRWLPLPARPLSKTVRFNVLKVIPMGTKLGSKAFTAF